MAVHLDHNATTPLRPEARAELLRQLDALGGNPSSLHAGGRRARAVIDEARERVAAALGVREEELVFTSGGTESNNQALFGALAGAGPGAALVTSAVEHSSVLEPARELARRGVELRVVAVDAAGRPDLDEVAARARGARLVSLMSANNETGAVLALAELGARLAALGPERPALHTDAVQALGRLPLEWEAGGVALASLSAHKVGGPVGVGLLVRRAGAALRPLLHGGGQEGGARPGTENAPAIAAAAVAIELAVREREDYVQRVGALTRALWRGIERALPDARLVGPRLDEARLANTLNVHVPGVDGRVLLTRLDLEGLEVSAGSACASGSLEPSHVLTAMGLSPEAARASLRLSLGRTTSAQDVEIAVETLRRVSEAMRATSG